MPNADATHWLVILGAIFIGALFLLALGRRLHEVPALRTPWDEAWACAVQAARMIRARPAVLWPAVIVTGLSVASWLASARPYAARPGIPFAEALVHYAQRDMYFVREFLLDPVSVLRDGLMTAVGGFRAAPDYPHLADTVIMVVAFSLLLFTVGSWSRAASQRQAGASAELLSWLAGPLWLLSGLWLYLYFFRAPWVGWPAYAIAMAFILLDAAWMAGVAGIILVTALRAMRGENPWAPADVAWGVFRHFRALFWLSFWTTLPYRIEELVHDATRSWWMGHWWGLRQAVMAPFDIIFVAIAFVSIIIVSEGTGALDGAWLALRAWRRAPLHLGIALGGVWVLLLAWHPVLSLLAVPARVVPIAIPMILVRCAVGIVLIVWPPALGLILWQRLRERVIAPAGEADAAGDRADAGNAAPGVTG
jgi:hypothetical protein